MPNERTTPWPLVSIILCSSNGEAFLPAQLSSLEKQDYPQLEFICSDNGSTDGTLILLQQWCDRQPNRRLITCPEKGLNKNFFGAIPHANGAYIIFCDQDDVWAPGKVSALLEFYRQYPGATLIYCLSKPFSGAVPDDLSLHGRINYLEGSRVRKTLLVSFTLGHNICIKKAVLDRIPVPGNEVVAYDWWITVSAMCIGEIKCLPKALTYWRKHTTNTTISINEGLFFENRVAYLRQFLQNPLIRAEDRAWIDEAIREFSRLSNHRFSVRLFLFLVHYANDLFFYKTKKNPVLKWISYVKWSLKMSRRDYRP